DRRPQPLPGGLARSGQHAARPGARAVGAGLSRGWSPRGDVDGPRGAMVERTLAFRVYPFANMADEARHCPLLERNSSSADLAQSRADTDRSGDGSQREIESASAARQIGDHEYGHNPEDPRPDAIH